MTKNRGQSTPMKSLQKEQWMHYLSTSVLLLAFYFFCYRLGNYIQWGSYSLSNWIISVQYLSLINQFTLNISDQVKFEKILQNTKILPKSKTLSKTTAKQIRSPTLKCCSYSVSDWQLKILLLDWYWPFHLQMFKFWQISVDAKLCSRVKKFYRKIKMSFPKAF